MSPKTPQEHIQKGWSFLVDEFFKKPARMAVAAIVFGTLVTGGTFAVNKFGHWLGRVISMDKRMVQVEEQLKAQAQTDSTLIDGRMPCWGCWIR